MFLYISVLCFIMLPLLCSLCYPANLMLPMLLCCFRDAEIFCLFFNSINFSVYYCVMILYIRVSGQGPWNFPFLSSIIEQFYSINLFIYLPFILLALFLYDNHSVAFHYFDYLWCHHLFTWLFIDRLLLFIC